MKFGIRKPSEFNIYKENIELPSEEEHFRAFVSENIKRIFGFRWSFFLQLKLRNPYLGT